MSQLVDALLDGLNLSDWSSGFDINPSDLGGISESLMTVGDNNQDLSNGGERSTGNSSEVEEIFASGYTGGDTNQDLNHSGTPDATDRHEDESVGSLNNRSC